MNRFNDLARPRICPEALGEKKGVFAWGCLR